MPLLAHAGLPLCISRMIPNAPAPMAWRTILARVYHLRRLRCQFNPLLCSEPTIALHHIYRRRHVAGLYPAHDGLLDAELRGKRRLRTTELPPQFQKGLRWRTTCFKRADAARRDVFD